MNTDSDTSTFGARLALVRQRVSIDNKACGVPVETWLSWERGSREPRRMTTVSKQVASATGCDYLWLRHGLDRGGSGGPAPARVYSHTRLLATIVDWAGRIL